MQNGVSQPSLPHGCWDFRSENLVSALTLAVSGTRKLPGLIVAPHWAGYCFRYMFPGLSPHPHTASGHRSTWCKHCRHLWRSCPMLDPPARDPGIAILFWVWQPPASKHLGKQHTHFLPLFLISQECSDLPTQMKALLVCR